MKPFNFLTAIFVLISALVPGQSETKRYLYMSTPDGAQEEGRSEPGILIFDIDDGHRFVRRIDIPIFSEGLRGFTGNAHALLEAGEEHGATPVGIEAIEELASSVHRGGRRDRRDE